MKYETVAGFVLIILLLVSVFTLVVPSKAADSHATLSTVDWWPMFHHDVLHTGDSSSKAPKTNNTIWTFRTGGSVGSSPSVVDGIVYVGSDDGNVYALNASTGAKIWSYKTGGTVQSSPAIAYGEVYVGSGDNNVYALNASTGAKIWSYMTGNVVYSSPVVYSNMVIIGSEDWNVYALDASAGSKIWNYNTTGWVDSSPAVVDGVVYVGSDLDGTYGGNVYALRASDGSKIWNYTTGGAVESSPAVAGNTVYVGDLYPDDSVYALNAATGVPTWSYTTGFTTDDGVASSPAVSGDRVYVGAGDKYYCLDASSGAFVWSYTTCTSGDASSPAVANGMVFVGSYDHNVYALNADSGALVWSYTTGDIMYLSSPAVAGGVVFVGSDDGNIYAFGPERYVTIPTIEGKRIKNGPFWNWIEGNFTKGNYKDMIFVFGTCFGGGFVNSLPTQDLANTVAMSASAWDKVSWRSPDSSTFLQGVLDAIKASPTNTVDQIFSDARNRDIAYLGCPNYWGGTNGEEDPQVSPSSGNNMKFHDGTSNYAILLAGHPDSPDWNNLARLYDFLTKSTLQGGLGYSAADVRVLYGDGTGKMPNGTWSLVPGLLPATRANVQLEIKSIAAQMNSGGTLLFWVADHGGIDYNVQDVSGFLGVIGKVGAHAEYQFQFDLDPAFIQAVSISDPPLVEIDHQNVTGSHNTVAINNVTVGSLDPTSNTTTISFSRNKVAFSPLGNNFSIVSTQDTDFTISSITLSSGPVAEQIPSQLSYNVTFTESGLPVGTEWWVNLGSDNQSSASNVISFSLPNGTYTYSTGASGYNASQSTGQVTVNGANMNEQVTFTTIPEFPSPFIFSVFMTAILLAAMVIRKRKNTKHTKIEGRNVFY